MLVLDQPYVGVSEFRRHPTFLDSENLVTGGTGPEQDTALLNVLLTASQMADDKCNMPLRAHPYTEQLRMFPTPAGQLRLTAAHTPVLEVTGLTVGAHPGALNPVANPQVWIERGGRTLVLSNFGGSGAGFGPRLQFGGLALSGSPAGEVMATWSYIAGYPVTHLSFPASANDDVMTVPDVTGISAGSVLRLWTPGQEEGITVAAVDGNVLTLASPLRYDHEAEDTCSALPTTIRQAVINFAVVLLMRPASGAENEYPEAQGSARGTAIPPAMSSTSGDKGRASGGTHLFQHACHLLKPYKRIW